MALFTPHLHRLSDFSGSARASPTGPAELDRGHPFAQGLQGFFPLTAHTRALNVAETSGPGWLGSLTAVPTFISGPMGGMMRTNNSGYCNLNNGYNPAATTVVAWVVPQGLANAYQGIVDRNAPSNFISLFLKSNGKLACYVSNSVGTSLSYDGTGAAAALTVGNLYFLAMSYDSVVGLKSYVNAVLDGSFAASGTLNQAATPTYAGAEPGTSGRNFNGLMSGVRLYDRALSADMIRWMYNEPWDDFRPTPSLISRRVSVANPTSFNGTVTYGETFAGTLTEANPLTGGYSYGAETAAGTLTQADAFTATVGYAPHTEGTLSQTNSYIGTLTFNPSVVGNLLEEDTLAGSVGYTTSWQGVIALDVHGTVGYDAPSWQGVIALDLHGLVDYGALQIAGTLASENSLTGVAEAEDVSFAGTFTQAVEFSVTVSYASPEVHGNLLEEDTLAGTISYAPEIRGTIVGAAFMVVEYSHSFAGTFAQANVLNGTWTAEVNSVGVFTDADNIVGTVTHGAQAMSGMLDAGNTAHGAITVDQAWLGNLLESDTLSGTVSYGAQEVAGTLNQSDPFTGLMEFTYEFIGGVHSQLMQAPDPATLPPGRLATVPFDSRLSLPIPFDSRIAR